MIELRNIKKIILIVVIAVCYGLWTNSVHAGLIFKAPQSLALSQGLVGWWNFDGKTVSGTKVYDASGNGNVGTMTNGPTVAKGKIGQGMNFDGSDDRIDMGTPEILNNLRPVTVTAWIYPRGWDSESRGRVWDKGAQLFFLYDDTDNQATFQVNINHTPTTAVSRAASNTLFLNNWQFVAYTFISGDGGVRLYAGSQTVPLAEVSYAQRTPESGTANDDSAQIPNIGANSADGSAFNGLIDDVRVYNRSLTSDEIKRLYNMGR